MYLQNCPTRRVPYRTFPVKKMTHLIAPTWTREAITMFLQRTPIPLRLAPIPRAGWPLAVSLMFYTETRATGPVALQ
jgi:hypothetical protein